MDAVWDRQTYKHVNGTGYRRGRIVKSTKRKMKTNIQKKRETRKRISAINFPSFPLCTILRPSQAASVSTFETTH